MAGELAEFPSYIVDEKSFIELYDCYWEKVYCVCYSHIRQVEIAQGMVQDIFRSIWERRCTLEIRTSPEKYLVRAAKFKVFEHIRNTQQRTEHLKNFRERCHDCTTEDTVLFQCLNNQVTGIVASLPEKCRAVYKMSRDEGLTNKEIAASLSITERAVEYHVSRALSTLRIQLKEYLT